jgi:hypothetical protein
MKKWLLITAIVITGFAIVLLGLGYLLKEHEIKTTLLKEKLDQERLSQQVKNQQTKKPLYSNHSEKFIELTPLEPNLAITKQRAVRISDDLNEPDVVARKDNKQQLLIDNLTCSSVQQCVLVDITFNDLTCHFAVNKIGASLLAKSKDTQSQAIKCPIYNHNSQLSCMKNICSYQ